jgi:hypothetical protein
MMLNIRRPVGCYSNLRAEYQKLHSHLTAIISSTNVKIIQLAVWVLIAKG